MLPTVTLRPGHVQPVWAGHPWVFAQAIARVEGDAQAGDEVRVIDPQGKFLGRGFYSPTSAIPVRIAERGDRPLDDARLRAKISLAAEWRRSLLGLPGGGTTGYRLVNAEGDGLPGLVADVFGDAVVAQLLTTGVARRREAVFEALHNATGARAIYTASSEKHQRIEGTMVTDGLAWGAALDRLEFTENGSLFRIAPPGADGGGQKTGYYFDQRENRGAAARYAKGGSVLDLCSFVGGFSLAAARCGATEVLAVDSSGDAVERGQRITADNGLGETVRWLRGDATKTAGALAREGRSFGVVVLDPPKLAAHPRELSRALGHYRRINAAASFAFGSPPNAYSSRFVSPSSSASMPNAPGPLLVLNFRQRTVIAFRPTVRVVTLPV